MLTAWAGSLGYGFAHAGQHIPSRPTTTATVQLFGGGQPVQVPVHQIRRSLLGLQFPADRDAIVRHVRSRGAQPQLLALVERLDDRTYRDSEDAARAALDGGTPDVRH